MPSIKAIGVGLLILLLGLAFWYVYNLGEHSGTYTERSRWQDQVLKLQKERDEARAKAETVIVKDRVVWRDRLQTIRETVVDCTLPADLIGVLRDSRVFTGG